MYIHSFAKLVYQHDTYKAYIQTLTRRKEKGYQFDTLYTISVPLKKNQKTDRPPAL